SSSSPSFFICTAPASTVLSTLSLHDALPIWFGLKVRRKEVARVCRAGQDASFADSFAGPASATRRLLPPGGTQFPAKNRAEEIRSEEHTSELQSAYDLVCRLLLEKKKKKEIY